MQIFLTFLAVGIGCFFLGVLFGETAIYKKLKFHEKIKSKGKEVDIDEEEDE